MNKFYYVFGGEYNGAIVRLEPGEVLRGQLLVQCRIFHEKTAFTTGLSVRIVAAFLKPIVNMEETFRACGHIMPRYMPPRQSQTDLPMGAAV